MTDASSQLDLMREQLENGERGGCEADRNVLLEFSDELYLIPSEVGDLRHVKLLRHGLRMAEEPGGLAAALENREAAENIVRWIHRNYDNAETNSDYRVALKQIGRRASDENGDDVPDSMEWIPSGKPSTYDPSPEPGDMLYWEEDVLPMIDATTNYRDAALIAVAWDAGARSGELRSLTVGDVTDHKHGYQITVQGKQGKRSVVLVPSVPYLQRWLEQHPGGERDDPLWCRLDRPEETSYQALRQALNTAGEKAGVEKPTTFTNFRKSSASHLARRGMSQAHLEDHHGWVRGSGIASRYISTFAEDTNREVARLHGVSIDEEDEPEPTAPVECPRCHQTTPREKNQCIHCQQPLSKEAAMQHMETCKWCGEPINSYPEHLPNCPEVDLGSGDAANQADD
jgi:integrase